MKAIRLLTRYIVGIVFIASGFLKGVDPVGTALKVKEYFHAFLGNEPEGRWALWIGIALCVAEFLAGVCLLKVIKFRFFSCLALLMSIFFTGLTFLSAYTGKVSDCGCFGDVIHLEPWHSFFKNLLLLALTVFLYTQRHRARPVAGVFWEWAFIVGYTAFIVGVSVYSMHNLPQADLSDFRPGRDLFSGDSTAIVKYKTEILYSKNGVTRKFNLNNLPDTSWTYVETISTVIEGSERIAKTMPFLLRDAFGEDVTEPVLKTQGPLIFISFYDAAGITEDDLGKLKNLGDSLGRRKKAEVYVLSAMAPDETEAVLKPIADAIESEDRSDIFSSSHSDRSLPFKVAYGDFKTVVTFNRSNGGATYVNQGLIVKKWSAVKYSNRKIMSAISKNPTALTVGSEERSRFFIAVSIAVIIGMVLIIRLVFRIIYKTVKRTVNRIEEIGE